MQIRDKKILVAGLGLSGEAAAKLAKSKKACVYVSEITKTKALQKKAKDLRKRGIAVELGRHSASFLKGADLLIVSPGLKDDSKAVVWAQRHKVPIISEIEFASWFCSAPVIAITGTNGKSTVATLIGKVLNKAGKRTIVCGNIGNPFSAEAARFKSADIVVLEVSSFALRHIKSFHPKVSVILNISQNHLDYHKTMSEYFRAKSRILANQKEDDFTVLNFDDARIRSLAKKTKAKTIYFSKRKIHTSLARNKCHAAAWLDGNNMKVLWKKKEATILSKLNLKLRGTHNYQNVMSVILACLTQNVDKKKMLDAILSFKGLEHRCEYVTTIRGVRFVNDSKATTVDATAQALSIFDRKNVVLICGGYDKGSNFACIRPLIKKKVRCLVVMGKARNKIKQALGNTVNTVTAKNLEHAVWLAFKNASPGDCVLLSPMCASFDMFENFEQRGAIFKKIVRDLR